MMDLKLFDAVFFVCSADHSNCHNCLPPFNAPPDDGGGDLRLPHQMRMYPMWTFYPFVLAPNGRSKRSWLFSSPMLSIV